MLSAFSKDINQLGSEDSKTVDSPVDYEPIISAIVEDVVVNEQGGTYLRYEADGTNLGQIIFREVPEDRGLEISQLRRANPIETTIQEYPLVGEQVLVYRTMGGLYYSRRVNVSRKPTDSVWSALQSAMADTETVVPRSRTRELLQSRGARRPSTPTTPLKVTRNSRTRFIRPSEGDVIVQGRFGTSMRMGSSLFSNPTDESPSPNLLITVGQWESPEEVSTEQDTVFSMYFENLNRDKSSIWMVSDETVPFLPVTATSAARRPAHLLSSNSPTTSYDGAQIFINSDRVVVNSKQNEISLFSGDEINLSSIGGITLDTEEGIRMTATDEVSILSDASILLKANDISIISTSDLSFKTSGNYSIVGERIFIGRYGDTSQPMVLGGVLSAWMNNLLSILMRSGTFISSVGPVTLSPQARIALQSALKSLGPTTAPERAVFNSRSNFTSNTN